MAAVLTSDVLIIGGGIVGAALGVGMAGRGASIRLLDGADTDLRAARANFGEIGHQRLPVRHGILRDRRHPGPFEKVRRRVLRKLGQRHFAGRGAVQGKALADLRVISDRSGTFDGCGHDHRVVTQDR